MLGRFDVEQRQELAKDVHTAAACYAAYEELHWLGLCINFFIQIEMKSWGLWGSTSKTEAEIYSESQ